MRHDASPLLSAASVSLTGAPSLADHGYSLGGFRIDSKKEQVYDHNTRVPLLLHGPGLLNAGEVDIPVSMADVAPTLLELAGGGRGPSSLVDRDGISFAAQVRLSPFEGPPAWPRDAVLIEYQSVEGGPYLPGDAPPPQPMPPVLAHSVLGGPLNTYCALRFTRGSLGELLYAEFTNVTDPLAWDFAPDRIQFYELYNMTADPYMLENLVTAQKVDRSLVDELHTRLHRAIVCRGEAECTASLSTSSGT